MWLGKGGGADLLKGLIRLLRIYIITYKSKPFRIEVVKNYIRGEGAGEGENNNHNTYRYFTFIDQDYQVASTSTMIIKNHKSITIKNKSLKILFHKK